MARTGFEPAMTDSERSKTVHVSDWSATATGKTVNTYVIITVYWYWGDKAICNWLNATRFRNCVKNLFLNSNIIFSWTQGSRPDFDNFDMYLTVALKRVVSALFAPDCWLFERTDFEHSFTNSRPHVSLFIWGEHKSALPKHYYWDYFVAPACVSRGSKVSGKLV
jgi:hypothetical protein